MQSLATGNALGPVFARRKPYNSDRDNIFWAGNGVETHRCVPNLDRNRHVLHLDVHRHEVCTDGGLVLPYELPIDVSVYDGCFTLREGDGTEQAAIKN